MAHHMPLEERVSVVTELLEPDEIRAHRVGQGLELTPEQAADLHHKAALVSLFSNHMGAISNAAIIAPGSDRMMRTVRMLFGTEPVHQAYHQGELGGCLPQAAIVKADLVLTADGFKIVEIEPGKVRGLGYARLVREQATNPAGIGVEAALAEITDGRPTGIALSETDRFHAPEMGVLARLVGNIVVVPQAGAHLFGTSLGSMLPQAIMMSPFQKGVGVATENEVRGRTQVVSDRRSDLESKGALALLHNVGQLPEIEALLLQHFTADELAALRTATPMTAHFELLNTEQRDELRTAIISGQLPVFVKPMVASGTRGIITPDQLAEIQTILSRPSSVRKVVVQEAVEGLRLPMHSVDVLTGVGHDTTVSLRITIHTTRDGRIIDASVVGSPHQHLAHGGKTSVITNLEMPR